MCVKCQPLSTCVSVKTMEWNGDFGFIFICVILGGQFQWCLKMTPWTLLDKIYLLLDMISYIWHKIVCLPLSVCVSVTLTALPRFSENVWNRKFWFIHKCVLLERQYMPPWTPLKLLWPLTLFFPSVCSCVRNTHGTLPMFGKRCGMEICN